MKKKGFTVLEVMLVLAVLATIAGIAMSSIKGLRDQSDMAKARSELGRIQTALESYYIHQVPHAYPDRDKYAATLTAFLSSVKVDPHVVVSALYDPFVVGGATEYFYHASENGKYYVVASTGPGGKADPTKVDDKGVVTKGGAYVICMTNGNGC